MTQGKMKFDVAFEVFTSTLKTNKMLYHAYQSTIASTFYDVVTGAGYRFPDLAKLSDHAAKNFLNLLINKGKREAKNEVAIQPTRANGSPDLE